MFGRKTRSMEGRNNFGAKVDTIQGTIRDVIFGAQVNMHRGIDFASTIEPNS